MTARLLNLQKHFEGSPLSLHEGGSDAQPLYLSREAVVIPSGLVSERRRMGIDVQAVFTRICAAQRHQWASNSYTDASLLPDVCPHCVAEDEDAVGRERYRALHVRLTSGL